MPTLFLFKRKSGVSEVIDGQQRILTLLGFIAEEYIDENGAVTRSRNHGFALRSLRILRELEKRTFRELPEDQKERIFDFPLYIVEIDEAQNPNFDPIDLFIRLNDKPFPIREHSFEMWNSWVDVEVIRELRHLTNSKRSWFFLKRLNSPRDRDRMENEELVASLVYLEYLSTEEPNRKSLDVFQSAGRINTRLTNKAHLSSLLQHVTEHAEAKDAFLKAIRRTDGLMQKLQTVLLDRDQNKDQRDEYLRRELDRMLGQSRRVSNFKRSKQDFFFIWKILHGLSQEMVRNYRLNLKEACFEIFEFIKDVPEPWSRAGTGLEEFARRCDALREEYRVQERRMRLSDSLKKEMLEKQENKCGISGAPLFIGDDIEVDHVLPLALGGADNECNLQIAHKSENKKKGAKKMPKG
ncbi:HNH endonuclease [uncultured Lamprocystis sp.]|uniref:HNH endonuclease n=2 Tax=uncultured Lamprocystis sp. TaxID=543132 RepID=UPI0025F7047E|nr:HNH endonuclease [uncultured Lamprocystis sp.]